MSKSEAYCMDCMEGMKQYPDKYFDLAVVDPPYGINVMSQPGGVTESISRSAEHRIPITQRSERERERESCIGGAKPFSLRGGGLVVSPKSYPAFDDSSIPGAGYFAELERVTRARIIWGGNYFLDFLGDTKCLIVWDKRRRGLDFADCELAWTNINEPSRIFEFKWNGMLQEDMKHKEERIHATQKPVALYSWLYEHYAEPGYKILDTHLGSGSSRIAAYERGLDFVGYEINKTIFDLQEERFRRHVSQLSLFAEVTE